MRVISAVRRAVALAAFAGRMSRLGPRPRDRMRLLAVTLLAAWLGERWPEIRVRGPRGAPVELSVNDLSDLIVVHEIFTERIYELGAGRSPRRILDLGAHIGVAASYFAHAHPGAEIVCAEPDPRNLRGLRRNAARLPGVRVEPVAVGGAEGRLELFSSREGWASGTRRVSAAQRAVSVAARPAHRLAEGPLDLIKLDIEGAERFVLADRELLARTSELIGELHPSLGGPTPEEAAVALAGFDVEFDPPRPHVNFRARRRP